MERLELRINIGSANPVKVEAVKEIFQEYTNKTNFQLVSKETQSDVSEQPLSLEETIQGAINRAKRSYGNCNCSVGIESGIFEVPKTRTGYMNITICAIYDGNRYSLGISSAFEMPTEVMRLILEENLDVDTAFYKAGLTTNPRVGRNEGSIGILTKGRLTRKDYTKEAVRMAIIQIVNEGYDCYCKVTNDL